MLSECSGIAIFGGSAGVVNSRRFIAAILWEASPTAIVQTGLISPSETPPTSRFATAGHGSSCRRRRRRTDGSGSRRHAPQGVHVNLAHGIDLGDRAGGEDGFGLGGAALTSCEVSRTACNASNECMPIDLPFET